MADIKMASVRDAAVAGGLCDNVEDFTDDIAVDGDDIITVDSTNYYRMITVERVGDYNCTTTYTEEGRLCSIDSLSKETDDTVPDIEKFTFWMNSYTPNSSGYCLVYGQCYYDGSLNGYSGGVNGTYTYRGSDNNGSITISGIPDTWVFLGWNTDIDTTTAESYGFSSLSGGDYNLFYAVPYTSDTTVTLTASFMSLTKTITVSISNSSSSGDSGSVYITNDSSVYYIVNTTAYTATCVCLYGRSGSSETTQYEKTVEVAAGTTTNIGTNVVIGVSSDSSGSNYATLKSYTLS